MEVTAVLKGVHLSPQKARLVANLVRGKKVDQALNIGADIDELKVTSIYVDKGIVMKRIRARAKGRAGRILKPTCHIHVTVGDTKA